MSMMYDKGFYERVAQQRNHWLVSSADAFWVADNLIYHRIIRIIRLCDNPSGYLLDVAAGDGYLTDMLRASGNRVVAADIASARLQQARRYAPRLSLLQMDATHPSIRADTLGIIVACEVVEHLGDYRQVFTEAHRMLMHRGHLIVSVPYKDPLEMVVCPHCGRSFHPWGHVVSFDEALLRAAFEEAGFTDVGLYFANNAISTRLSRWLRLPFRIVQLIDRYATFLAPHMNRHMIGIGRKP